MWPLTFKACIALQPQSCTGLLIYTPLILHISMHPLPPHPSLPPPFLLPPTHTTHGHPTPALQLRAMPVILVPMSTAAQALAHEAGVEIAAAAIAVLERAAEGGRVESTPLQASQASTPSTPIKVPAAAAGSPLKPHTHTLPEGLIALPSLPLRATSGPPPPTPLQGGQAQVSHPPSAKGDMSQSQQEAGSLSEQEGGTSPRRKPALSGCGMTPGILTGGAPVLL